ncbi:MAG: hypothetical protein AAF416_22810 [Pseudomonadota bacterium]
MAADVLIFGVIEPSVLGEGAELLLSRVGIAGAVLYLANYTSLQLRLLDGNGVLYTALNTLAAALVLAGLTFAFNPGAAIIQIAWLIIGTFGLLLRFYRARIIRRGANGKRILSRDRPFSQAS